MMGGRATGVKGRIRQARGYPWEKTSGLWIPDISPERLVDNL